jgi:hypothetical protein
MGCRKNVGTQEVGYPLAGREPFCFGFAMKSERILLGEFQCDAQMLAGRWHIEIHAV